MVNTLCLLNRNKLNNRPFPVTQNIILGISATGSYIAYISIISKNIKTCIYLTMIPQKYKSYLCMFIFNGRILNNITNINNISTCLKSLSLLIVSSFMYTLHILYHLLSILKFHCRYNFYSHIHFEHECKLCSKHTDTNCVILATKKNRLHWEKKRIRLKCLNI